MLMVCRVRGKGRERVGSADRTITEFIRTGRRLLTMVRVDGPARELRAPYRFHAGVYRIGLSTALVHDAPALCTILHSYLGPFDRLERAVIALIRATFVGILRHHVIGAQRCPCRVRAA